jgi:ABC-type glutathione transport system ATPase component
MLNVNAQIVCEQRQVLIYPLIAQSTVIVLAEEKRLLVNHQNPPKGSPLSEECLSQMCNNILKEINDWLLDFQKPNILWLFGSPGAGKSTIAMTVARKMLHQCTRLFCNHNSVDLSDPRTSGGQLHFIWQNSILL